MAKRSNKSKTPKSKRPGPAAQRTGTSIAVIEPDLSNMTGTYKVKLSRKPRISGGVPGTSNRRHNGSGKKRTTR